MSGSERHTGNVGFAGFTVDLAAGQLRKHGLKVNLREQSFVVLAMLLEHPGAVVTREELRAKLWPGDVFVDFEGNLNTAVARLREVLGDSADKPRFIETLPKRGYRFIGETVPGAVARPDRKLRLAVLPLSNLSGDPGQEYFSDGMTEEIITQLAGLAPDRLGVIARTTAMLYKGGGHNVAHIGAELGLDYLLEGSVRREGGQVRITVQLIQVSDQTHLWSESYDGKLRHILDLQNRVARSVAEQIRIAVPESACGPVGLHRPVDPEANDAFLEGLYHLSRQNPAALARAVECLDRAVRIDPLHARAYAKLAAGYSMAGYFGYARHAEVFPKARAAAARALELDERLPEAHFALGLVHMFHTWDFAACEREFDRAIQLSPNDPNAHFGRAGLLAMFMEDHAGAAVEIELARELDPLSMVFRINAGWQLYWARKFDRARQHASETISLDPDCAQAYNIMGLAWIGAGDPLAALHALEEGARRSPDPLSLCWLAMARGLAGQRELSMAMLQECEKPAGPPAMPSICLSWVHIGLGNFQRAIELMEKAHEEHDAVVLCARVSPSFDLLRGEPRFRRLIRRLNLPPRHRSSRARPRAGF